MADLDQRAGITDAIKNAAAPDAEPVKKGKKRGPYKKRAPEPAPPPVDAPKIRAADRLVPLPDMTGGVEPILSEVEAQETIKTLAVQGAQLLQLATLYLSQLAGSPRLPSTADATETADAILRLAMLYGPSEVTAGTVAQIAVAGSLIKMVANAQPMAALEPEPPAVKDSPATAPDKK